MNLNLVEVPGKILYEQSAEDKHIGDRNRSVVCFSI